MATLRLLLNFMVGGALIGVLAVSLLGPKYIAWDNTPGSGATAMCICSEVALQGAQRMISYQMTYCAVGAGVGAVVAALYMYMRRKASQSAVVVPPKP